MRGRFLNKSIYLIVMMAALFLSCSDLLDSSTSLGSDILRDKNPKITDPDQVLIVDSVRVPVVEVKSIRRALDGENLLGPGVYVGTPVVAGTWDDQKAAGYLEFFGDFPIDSNAESFQQARFIVSASAIAAAAPIDTGATFSQQFTIYVPKTNFEPGDDFSEFVAATVKDSLLTKEGSFTVTAKGTDNGLKVDSIYEVVLDGALISENIRLKGSASAGDTVSDSIRFLIVPGGENQIASTRLSAQLEFEYAAKDSAGKTFTSTRNFTASLWGVTETTENLDQQPVSLWASERFTRIALDMTPYWDSLFVRTPDDTVEGVLTAELLFSVDTSVFAQSDLFLVGYDFLPDTSNATSQLAFADTLEVAPNSSAQISIDLVPVMESFVVEGFPSTAYLFLLAISKREYLNKATWAINENSGLLIRSVLSNPR